MVVYILKKKKKKEKNHATKVTQIPKTKRQKYKPQARFRYLELKLTSSFSIGCDTKTHFCQTRKFDFTDKLNISLFRVAPWKPKKFIVKNNQILFYYCNSKIYLDLFTEFSQVFYILSY